LPVIIPRPGQDDDEAEEIEKSAITPSLCCTELQLIDFSRLPARQPFGKTGYAITILLQLGRPARFSFWKSIIC
jgi:hypothetical protein